MPAALKVRMAGWHLEEHCGGMASTAMPIPGHPHAQGKPERPPSWATRLNDVKITIRVRFRPELVASLYSDPPSHSCASQVQMTRVDPMFR